MDHKNGKIYRILNTIDNDCYVGSTTQRLSKRMAKHREDMCRKTTSKSKLYTKMRELGPENFYIELIEEFPCENIEQLRKREGELIRLLGTLNIHIAGRSKQQWDIDHRDERRIYLKNYYENNKDLLSEKGRQYREAHRDEVKERKKKWHEDNRESILAKHKLYYEATKEQRLEKAKQYKENNKDKIK